MNEQERGEKAFGINKKITENELKRRELFAENVGYLGIVQEEELYKDILGDPEAEWVAYLSQLDVYYTRSEINKWLRVKHKISHEFGLDFNSLLDIPITRLDKIASYAKDKVDAEGLLAKARVYTSREWKDEINLRTGKATSDDGHRHEFVDYKICAKCGNKQKAK